MKNNRAIGLISLVITIIIIIIIAAISTPLLSSVMTDSTELDAREELQNVSTIVQIGKARILNDEFVPNANYVISDSELDSKFGTVLSPAEIQHIKTTNAQKNLGLPFKYFLMNQERFNTEFDNGANVKNIRESREYLVNYIDTLVVLNYNGQRLDTGPSGITEIEEVQRGAVAVEYMPNGNMTWKKQQSTSVNLIYNMESSKINAKYLWASDPNQPSDLAFDSASSDYGGTLNKSGSYDSESGITTATTSNILLKNETGNGWYLWIRITYDDDGIERKKYIKSEPFFIDNTPPTATLQVN